MEREHQAEEPLTEEEAEQRLREIAIAVLTAKPKPRKDVPRKRPYKPRKKTASGQRG